MLSSEGNDFKIRKVDLDLQNKITLRHHVIVPSGVFFGTEEPAVRRIINAFC